MRNLPDHGLPLVQLKEQRRDLVVALQNRNGPVTGWELMQIASIQQAIQACLFLAACFIGERLSVLFEKNKRIARPEFGRIKHVGIDVARRDDEPSLSVLSRVHTL